MNRTAKTGEFCCWIEMITNAFVVQVTKERTAVVSIYQQTIKFAGIEQGRPHSICIVKRSEKKYGHVKA